MKKYVKYYNNKLIRNLLLHDYGYGNTPYAIFIHASVLPGVRECITNRYGDNWFSDRGPYELQIGEQFYDMRLILISREPYDFRMNWSRAQFSFLWQNEPTLFMELNQFAKLEEFIRIKNLAKFIVATEERQGINSHNSLIKIVKFNEHVNYENLISDFDKFLSHESTQNTSDICHFYITYAFPWLQQSRLRAVDKSWVNDEFYIDLITYFTCQRELCYVDKTEFPLNVIELCSLKLAFCTHIGTESTACAFLAHEIEAAIFFSLNRLVKSDQYFRDDHFNLHQYARDKLYDLSIHDLANCYFCYYFQDWFNTITLPKGIFDNITDYINGSDIVLAEEHEFALSRLSKFPKTEFYIDGTNFSGMDYKLFAEFFKYGNVYKIVLDTNYEWLTCTLQAIEPLDLRVGIPYRQFNSNEPTLLSNYRRCDIYFVGSNKFHFIEDCIRCIKFIHTTSIQLHFTNPMIQDYAIFQNLNVAELWFEELTFTSVIVQQLMDFVPEQIEIVFKRCHVDDDMQTWMLLNELNHEVEIVEDEKTWQYMFESIANQLIKSELNKFTFRNDVAILLPNKSLIELKNIKFAIDDTKSQLELRDPFTNRALDLYDLKNVDDETDVLEEFEKIGQSRMNRVQPSYEFYQ